MSKEKLILCRYQIDKQKYFSKLGNQQEIGVVFYFSLGAVTFEKKKQCQ